MTRSGLEQLGGVVGDAVTGECARRQNKNWWFNYTNNGVDVSYFPKVECILAATVDDKANKRHILRLYGPETDKPPKPNVQTFFLPLFFHNSASFTTVPRSRTPYFFITASLTGCDVFVASAGSPHPLVLIHTNCHGTNRTGDVSHQQAIAVLSLNISGKVQYESHQIHHRLAHEEQRSKIDAAHYDYNVNYYDCDEGASVFYGYTYGTSTSEAGEPWIFCFRNKNRKQGPTCIACP